MADILGERDDNIPDRPTRVAEPSRESQLPKKFYKSAEVAEEEGFFKVLLDGRPVRTPGKSVLQLNSQSVMESIAIEWNAQVERIDPMTMPVTRLINTAIDGVSTEMQAVKEDIIRYAGTDFLCYRAEAPDQLVERQSELWDPMIDWAQSSLGARFVLAAGVMHVDQPPESINAFSVHVGLIEHPAVLAATHVVMTLTGSSILAMAVLKDHLTAEEAWELAHVDEDWNISLWGEDEEAMERRAKRLIDMTAACDVIRAMA